MKPGTLEYLVSRLIDDDLAPEEADALAAEIEQHPEWVPEIAAHLALSECLAQEHKRERSADAFLAGLETRLAAVRNGDDFVAKTMVRIGGARESPRRRAVRRIVWRKPTSVAVRAAGRSACEGCTSLHALGQVPVACSRTVRLPRVWGVLAVVVCITLVAGALRYGVRAGQFSERAGARIAGSWPGARIRRGAVELVAQRGIELRVGDWVLVPGSEEAGTARPVDGPGVIITYPGEHTQIFIGGSTAFHVLSRRAGKQFRLERGAITVNAARQPLGKPMKIFTPHAEVVVVGTRFELLAETNRTRVEVEKGTVEFTRVADRASVQVREGHYAVAAVGVALISQPLPTRSNLLRDPGFEEGGAAWSLGSGRVVDSPVHSGTKAFEMGRGLAQFHVPVVAGKKYRASVWVKVDQGAALLELYWMDSAGRYIRKDVLEQVETPTGWRQLSGTQVAPSGATTVNFAVVQAPGTKSGPTAVWVDDCEMTEVQE